MTAREIVAVNAASMLADAVAVAIERLDGPASVRDPAEALDVLQAALGCARPALDFCNDRGTAPLAPMPVVRLVDPVPVGNVGPDALTKLRDFFAGRIQAEIVNGPTPMRGASS